MASKDCCSLVAKPCATLLWPHELSPPDSSVRGISQARILEWVAIFSRELSQPRYRTHVSCVSCFGIRLLYYWATREARKECYPFKCEFMVWCLCVWCKVYLFIKPKFIRACVFACPCMCFGVCYDVWEKARSNVHIDTGLLIIHLEEYTHGPHVYTHVLL